MVPLRKLRWIGLRLLILAPFAAWAAAGGPWQAPIMWVLFAYLVVRALPGMRSDLAKARNVLGLRRGYSVRGGEL